ncbi:MAG: hypothetical protein K6U74_12585 [Firmicutes bacterium]|nr:hypothetical protein [Bacillota bacterium]
MIKELDSQLDEYKRRSAMFGESLIHLLDAYEASGATDHDLAQLLNCNMKDMGKYRSDYKESDGDHHGFFIAAVFEYRAEYRPRKGDGDFIPPGITPLFDAIVDRFMLELETNRKLREEAWEKVEEIIPEIRGMQYVLTKGPGGEKRLEKYYPPLKRVK